MQLVLQWELSSGGTNRHKNRSVFISYWLLNQNRMTLVIVNLYLIGILKTNLSSDLWMDRSINPSRLAARENFRNSISLSSRNLRSAFQRPIHISMRDVSGRLVTDASRYSVWLDSPPNWPVVARFFQTPRNQPKPSR